MKRNRFDFLDIRYGPGIVQKLCAKFIQMSKQAEARPQIRSPRFKRRKLTSDNIPVVAETRLKATNATDERLDH